MDRTYLLRVCVTVLCLTLAPLPAFAMPVKHGAMEICEVIDGGTVVIVDGTEVCCASEIVYQDDVMTRRRNFRCVECDPPGSDNCEETPASQAPGDRVVTILLTTALAEQRELRKELDNLPAKVLELCAPVPPTRK